MGCAAVLATPEATTALVLTQDRHGPRTEQARPGAAQRLATRRQMLVDTTGRTCYQTGADPEPLAARLLQVGEATQIAVSYLYIF